ncbi:hypothetical protein [Streptomyces sp. NPDC002952]|uniref:hypothetical protein n=1 Tax=Streptomyces sp. NPDC002952 TaxID=3364673 RepID=UPI00369747A8
MEGMVSPAVVALAKTLGVQAVTRNNAVNDAGPPISAGTVQKPFTQLGLPAGVLRVDRIYDEARHSADPGRLIKLFGPSNLSATR